MVASRKATAAANRARIADALVRLQQTQVVINLQVVARAAEVHPDTIRRNPDLFAEVVRLRDTTQAYASLGPARAPNQVDSSGLQAKLLDAQGEISELRKKLTQAVRSAHNALGASAESVSREEADQLRQEATELRVRLSAAQEQISHEKVLRERLTDELTATNEVNRELVRDLTASKEDLLRLRQRTGKHS